MPSWADLITRVPWLLTGAVLHVWAAPLEVISICNDSQTSFELRSGE
jgi:hypothetical protein